MALLGWWVRTIVTSSASSVPPLAQKPKTEGCWQMRYLGTFSSEEEAARAFDQEAIMLRGVGIELNLPHEAPAFMAKLKEEEDAATAHGTPPPLTRLLTHPTPTNAAVTVVFASVVKSTSSGC